MALSGKFRGFGTSTYPRYLVIIKPGMSSNNTWMAQGVYSCRSGGGSLTNTSYVYKIFNGGWTSYLNKFNSGTWIDICLPEAQIINGCRLASYDSLLPATGEIYYSDDGKNYTLCGSWKPINYDATWSEAYVNQGVGPHRIWRLKSTSNTAGDYSFTAEDGIRFNGRYTYGKSNVSLVDKTNWLIDLSIKTNEERSGKDLWNQPCILGVDTAGYHSRDFHIDVKNGNLYLFSGLGGTNEASQLGVGTLSTTSGDYGWDTGIHISDGRLHNIVLEFKDNQLHLSLDGNYLGYLNTTLTVGTDTLYIGSSYPDTKAYCTVNLTKLVVKIDGEIIPSIVEKCANSFNMDISEALLWYYEDIDYTLPDGIGGRFLPLVSYVSKLPLLSKKTLTYATYNKMHEIRKLRIRPNMSKNGTWRTENDYTARSGGKNFNNLTSAYRVFNGGWTSYLNKFNSGTYVEICLMNPIAVIEVYLSSSDGYLPARGEIYYSDDGETYTKCTDWVDTSNSKNCTCTFDDVGAHKIWRITSSARSTAHPSSNADISQALLYYVEEITIDPWEGRDPPLIAGIVSDTYTTYREHNGIIINQLLPYVLYSKKSELRINRVIPNMVPDNGTWWEEGKFSFRASAGVHHPEVLCEVFQGGYSGDEHCVYGNNANEWIEICLDEPLKIVSIYLQSHNGYLPRGVVISYSDDGENYKDIATWNDTTSANQEGTVDIQNSEAHRMWRITSTGTPTSHPRIDANISQAILYYEELVVINPWEGMDAKIAGFMNTYATARLHDGLQCHHILAFVTIKTYENWNSGTNQGEDYCMKVKSIGFMRRLDRSYTINKVPTKKIQAILHKNVLTGY